MIFKGYYRHRQIREKGFGRYNKIWTTKPKPQFSCGTDDLNLDLFIYADFLFRLPRLLSFGGDEQSESPATTITDQDETE